MTITELLNHRNEINGGRHINLAFGVDPNRPVEHSPERPSDRHKDVYQQATNEIRSLYNLLAENPDSTLQQNPDAMRIGDILTQANESIKRVNQEQGSDPERGIIHYMDLLGKWRAYLKQPSLKDSQIPLIEQWCNNFGYPAVWAHPVSDQQRGAHPGSSQPRDRPHITNTAANDLQLSTIAGQIRTLAIRPRLVSRFVRPGYTSSGEEICMIQWLGKISPRFVVMDSQGGMRLMSSAAAGGQPALDGAMREKKPSTTTKPSEIKILHKLVIRGGGYGLSWVAVGELHPDRTKLPFIVVGFWHEGSNGRTEVGISRSSLAKIVSSKEAERLISESLVGVPDFTVREALNILAPGAIRDPPPPQLALPYESHTHYGTRSQRSHQPNNGIQTYAGQPYAGQPYAGQPYAGQPYAGQPNGVHPYGAQLQQPVFPGAQYQTPRGVPLASQSYGNSNPHHPAANQVAPQIPSDEEEEL